MKGAWVRILWSMVIVLLLAGCWNRRELDELGIAVGMGIDREDGMYRVSVQVVQPGAVASRSGSQSTRSPVTIYEASGSTIFEAYRKMTTTSPRKIYTSHLRIVVISEQLAREGVGKSLDVLSRDHEFRTDYYLLVARGTNARSVLQVLTPMEQIPANKLYSSIETSERVWAPTAGVTLDQFITDLVSDGKQPVLAGVRLRGEAAQGGLRQNVESIAPYADLQLSGLAAFKEDKLAGWLNEKESKGVNYVTGRVQSTVAELACPEGDGIIAFEVIRSDSDIKGSFKDGKPQIHIHVRLEENVGEVECRIDLNNPDTMEGLKKLSEKHLQELIQITVQNAQNKYKSDIFGFGNALHRADPKAWKRLKEGEADYFPHIAVTVSVDSEIRRVGTVNNSFLQDIKE